MVPVYEISNKASHMPVNKTELVDYVKNNMARQFHQVRNVSGVTINYVKKVGPCKKVEEMLTFLGGH